MVLSKGRVQVQRAEGLEEVAPDTVVTIHPGEAVIYVDNQAAQTFRNPGRSTLTAISFGVFSAAPPSTFTEGAVSQEDWERSGLAGHDLTVSVERLTVPPGARLPAFVPDARDLASSWWRRAWSSQRSFRRVARPQQRPNDSAQARSSGFGRSVRESGCSCGTQKPSRSCCCR